MEFKTRHYAIRTPDGYCGMDARTKRLAIYEDWQSAVDDSRGCDVVAVEVYDQSQKAVIDEMHEALTKLVAWADGSSKEAYGDLEQARAALAKASGEDSNPSTLQSPKQGF